jgi:STE24 endopeptidase
MRTDRRLFFFFSTPSSHVLSMTSLLSPLKAKLAQVETLLDNDSIQWMLVIQSLLLAVLSFELLVSFRQLKMYAYPSPPPQLKEHVDQETFIKSREYGKDKLYFSLFTLIFEWALSAGLIYLGAYARIWRTAGNLMPKLGFENDSEIIHSLLFILLSQPMTSIPMLPLSIYRHFVLEEKHGFNKMTMKTFVFDGVKEWAVGVVIMGPLMAGLIKLIRWAGDGFVGESALLAEVDVSDYQIIPSTITSLCRRLLICLSDPRHGTLPYLDPATL